MGREVNAKRPAKTRQRIGTHPADLGDRDPNPFQRAGEDDVVHRVLRTERVQRVPTEPLKARRRNAARHGCTHALDRRVGRRDVPRVGHAVGIDAQP